MPTRATTLGSLLEASILKNGAEMVGWKVG